MSQLPKEPRNGDRVTSEWGSSVVRKLRDLEGRLNRATSARSDWRRGGASGAAPTESTEPEPFEVFSAPLTPPPASGRQEALFILLGRVNGAVARLLGDGTTRTWLEAVALNHARVPASGHYRPGGWTYVALRIAGKNRADVFVPANSDASIIVTEYLPDDSDEAEYLPLAAVRATMLDGAGKHGFEIVQMRTGDVQHRLRLPMECITLAHPAAPLGVINMKRGRVTQLIADMVSATGFNDLSSYGGSRQFSFFCRALKIPSFQAGTQSLWFALEYPKTGARLATADYGTLKLTPTSVMPSSCPWIVVAEKNLNAEAARNTTTDRAVPTSRPQSGSGGSGSAGGEGTSAGDAQDALAAAFTAQEGDVDTTTDADAQSTGIENGLAYNVTIRKYTRVVTRNGEVVFRESRSGLWQLSYSMPDSWGAEQKACIGGPGYNPGQVKYSAESSRHYDAGVPTLAFMDSAPNGTQILARDYSSGLTTNGTTISNWAATYIVVSNGVRTSVNLRLMLSVVRYVSEKIAGTWYGGTESTSLSILYTYGGVAAGSGAQFISDVTGSDPEGDNPGRDPGDGADNAPTNDPPVDLGALDKNGAKLTSPGPGIWVWEIARIYPDGRVEQRHVGDILFSPAPQVQLRENAKVAARP